MRKRSVYRSFTNYKHRFKLYNQCGYLSFFGADTIYNLQLSGNISLQTDTSLVRVILADSLGEEFMVFEAYPLKCSQDFFS